MDAPLKFTIDLSSSLEVQRTKIEYTFLRAMQRVEAFASKNGWKELVRNPFIKHARIFDAKPEFHRYLEKLTGQLFDGNPPSGLSAVLENGEFLSVSPTLYLEIYPEANEPNAFEKLIAHEIIHRLHVRILKGNEDAMGPVWFYEGFAILGAGQFEKITDELSKSEILELIKSEKRRSYRKYAGVMLYILKRTSLLELVSRAKKPDFVSWLSDLI
ncbi:MAG: hypothetical protein AABZ06_14990 [Bdellovibrionota bacterium]